MSCVFWCAGCGCGLTLKPLQGRFSVLPSKRCAVLTNGNNYSTVSGFYVIFFVFRRRIKLPSHLSTAVAAIRVQYSSARTARTYWKQQTTFLRWYQMGCTRYSYCSSLRVVGSTYLHHSDDWWSIWWSSYLPVCTVLQRRRHACSCSCYCYRLVLWLYVTPR